ncbi:MULTISPECIES: chemotaxis protein CheW [unclassified Sphingomonas]|uniref:chemotaxis protein CheW n=1 Tax=unclassified Sphingomonas TaxID=196159 RepID=UPI000302C028|nr:MULTISPECIES: chemotaxis protein CheW [unclassified Sphingomonas]KTF70183.1 chemotaxis protein CheW [Sphingomonas sp. WG]
MSNASEIQVVTFGLGAEIFAVPVTLVREILDYRETFRIPNGPDYLLGLTDMRGQGVTTIDFRMRLGLPPVAPTPSTRILVVDVPVADRVLMLGLVVDRVLEVCSVRTDQLGSAPDIGVRWPSDYIAGVVKREEGFVVLVEMGRIFSAEEAGALQHPSAVAA